MVSKKEPTLNRVGTSLDTFHWDDGLALGVMPSKARYRELLQVTMKERSPENAETENDHRRLLGRLHNWRGCKSFGRIGQIAQGGTTDPDLTCTMRSKGFANKKPHRTASTASKEALESIRTVKVCLSNPTPIDPPEEYKLSGRRVRNKKADRQRSEVLDIEDEGEGDEAADEGTSEDQTASKRTRR